MINEFIDIKGFEGIYSINKNGVVRSEDRWVKANKGGTMFIEGKTFNGWLGKDGYIHIKLSQNNIGKPYKMHQLLAQAFIPNPYNYNLVRHLNDIRNDNRLENLAWGTRKDNAYDQIRNGQFKSISKSGKENFMYGKKGELSPNFKRNIGIDNAQSKLVLDTESGIYYYCAKEAADAKGFKRHNLYQKLRGKIKNNTSLIYV